MAVIANLTVLYSSYPGEGEPWKVRTQAQRNAEGIERWITRLVQVRNEQERRKQQEQ